MLSQASIEARLRHAFAPNLIEVVDESERHAGHAGVRQSRSSGAAREHRSRGPGEAVGGTHFRVTIEAAAFTGLSRVQRHRLVYSALTAEFEAGLHALALVTRAPGEIG